MDRPVRRFVSNPDAYFGYDLTAPPINGGREVRLCLGPLTLAPYEISPGKPDRQLARSPRFHGGD